MSFNYPHTPVRDADATVTTDINGNIVRTNERSSTDPSHMGTPPPRPATPSSSITLSPSSPPGFDECGPYGTPTYGGSRPAPMDFTQMPYQMVMPPSSSTGWSAPYGGVSASSTPIGRPIRGRYSPNDFSPNQLFTPSPVRGPNPDNAVDSGVQATFVSGPSCRRQLFPPRAPVLPPPPPPSTLMSPSLQTQLKASAAQQAESARRRGRDPDATGRSCKFCKNNGETKDLYSSHVLRNPVTGVLICPVLRHHECEVCGATGDNAHTRNYCPVLKKELRRHDAALPVQLKRTRRQSDGHFR